MTEEEFIQKILDLTPRQIYLAGKSEGEKRVEAERDAALKAKEEAERESDKWENKHDELAELCANEIDAKLKAEKRASIAEQAYASQRLVGDAHAKRIEYAEAQAAAMREALETILADERTAEMDTRLQEKALSSDAGKELLERVERLRAVARHGKELGVDSQPAFEDPRLSYVEVQLDPDERKDFIAVLAALKPGDLGEGQ